MLSLKSHKNQHKNQQNQIDIKRKQKINKKDIKKIYINYLGINQPKLHCSIFILKDEISILKVGIK